MFDFQSDPTQPKPELYRDLVEAARALTADEPDGVANMANLAALIWQFVPRLNWAGFYLFKKNELVLGPFQGKLACTRIKIGRGVCGTAAQELKTQRVPDVHGFAGHIACDSASQSEIVIPIVINNVLYGVLDLDSPVKARFNEVDQHHLEKLVQIIEERLNIA